ncbi:MAG: ActS/PrrB/RegB family redox-sensitive histidine kinase [Marinosulfonomonas sp.]|nr:ActS/PrrB/RegB family redox-sensitive histidine kinase [Marinosulfonomonas sp.]
MDNRTTGPLPKERRSNWVRLRTLIILRWIAIFGQLVAIIVAQSVFKLNLDLGFCLMAVGTLIIANLIAIFVYPKNKRVTEQELTLMLLFDVTQLSALLYLTGGLHNPFALLILAPVSIAATALRTGPTIIIGVVAIALATLVLLFHLPLHDAAGTVLRMPQIFVFGFWTAILIGVVFLGGYARSVASEITTMSEALLATQMALAREQKITDLAGVVAAAAHELGTPLATIKLASTELIDDLDGQGALQEDARLIRDQTDRCRDILRDMGRAGKDDLHMHYAPLIAVIRDASEPHSDRGKTVTVSAKPADGGDTQQPDIKRSSEIIHGLRNLIQNAVDFADTSVWVNASWSDTTITVRIMDDGDGFPPNIIGRIGDPYVSDRRSDTTATSRPGYQGMGLGLFIAKTLLERSGAELVFANGRDAPQTPETQKSHKGAIVEVIWPTDSISRPKGSNSLPLGANTPIPT